MFPGADATIYRNEAGEPLGWSYESTDPMDHYDEWETDDEEDIDEEDPEDLPTYAEAETEAEALLPKEPMDMELGP